MGGLVGDEEDAPVLVPQHGGGGLRVGGGHGQVLLLKHTQRFIGRTPRTVLVFF